MSSLSSQPCNGSNHRMRRRTVILLSSMSKQLLTTQNILLVLMMMSSISISTGSIVVTGNANNNNNDIHHNYHRNDKLSSGAAAVDDILNNNNNNTDNHTTTSYQTLGSKWRTAQQEAENSVFNIVNGQLPMDREINIYVLSGEAKRLYYQIHESGHEMTVTVTPCESPIVWKLSFLARKRPTNKDRRSKNNNRRRYKRRHNKLLMGRNGILNKAKTVLLANYSAGTERTTFSDMSSSAGLYIIDFNSLGNDVAVKVYVSQHYPYPLAPNDQHIDVRQVKAGELLINWPMSPSESVQPIDYCVAVSSGGGGGGGQRHQHRSDSCLMDAYLRGGDTATDEQYELDLIPEDRSNSFAYWWGRTVKNMLRQSQLRALAANNVRIACVGKQRWHLIPVYDSTPQQGQQQLANDYRIDVYARNSLTNATTKYQSVSYTIVNSRPLDISDDNPVLIKLNATNNYTQLLHYKTTTTTAHWDVNNTSSSSNDRTAAAVVRSEKLWFLVNSCSGSGPMTISARLVGPDIVVNNNNGNSTGSSSGDSALVAANQTSQDLLLFTKNVHLLKSEEFSVTTTTTSAAETNGSLFLVFELRSATGIAVDGGGDRTVVFMATNRYNRFPFPLMPTDTQIKLMSTLTDCQSVTLAWNASPDDRVQYCIYSRKVDNHYQSVNRLDSVCPSITTTTAAGVMVDMVEDRDTIDNNNQGFRKVQCKRYQKWSSRRRFGNKIIQSVKRLTAGQTYVFQVLVTKHRGRTLAYEQVWATTKQRYQC
ncbi:protein NDNF-like [Oppia nitens]|uniref:protein NDNF-like n=1 Tax=Oppia nitens TaxID=1686743 RepID=UPI0023DC1D7A|nr:protein NDNF-like [Oppia nitens]